MVSPDLPIEDEDSEVDDRLIKLLWDYDEQLLTGSSVNVEDQPALAATLAVDGSDRLAQNRSAIDLLSWAGPTLAVASSMGWSGYVVAPDSPPTGRPGNDGRDLASAGPTCPNREGVRGRISNGMELPRQFGRFQIVRELGRGGLGVVLLANDPVLKRKVALKIPRPEALLTPDLRQRFAREGQAAARLTHPNLVAVYEVGDVGPVAFIAAAYCNGPNLAEWLANSKQSLSPRAAAEIVAQLADGIAYAHAQGVLHRDLKPGNVVLEMHERSESVPYVVPDRVVVLPFTPKITDFGLARIADNAGGETRAGLLMGTPAYMAPEQVAGRTDEVGCQADVYALGTILYELLANQPAFSGATDLETLRRVTHEEPIAPRKLSSHVPPDLEAICLKCLQKLPGRRYAGASALAADLRRFLAGRPTQARPPSSIERLLKWARRQPATASLIGVAAAALTGIVMLSAIYIGWLRQANEAAEAARTAAEVSAARSRIQERVANEHLYASRMRLAYQSLDHGDSSHVRTLLDQYGPGKSWESLRGFEWYQINQRLHQERATFVGHRGEVYAVTFSPDGRRLLSGGEDGTIRVWDPQGGRELKSVPAHANCVNVLVFSPDGAILASGSCDHMIKLWDATTLQLLGTLEGHANEVHCLAFRPNDPRCLAAGGHESMVRVWDLPTREVVRTFDAGSDVNGLAWRPDGAQLFVASGKTSDARSFAWRIEDDHVTTFPWLGFAVAVSSTGDTGWGLRDLLVHAPATAGAQPRFLPSHDGSVRAVTFSPGGKQMATGGFDRAIRIWDAETQVCTQTLSGHTGWVQALAFSPAGSLLASASFDGTIKLWNSEPSDQTDRSVAYSYLRGSSWPFAIASADLQFLAVPNGRNSVRVSRLADGSLHGELPISSELRWIQFHPRQNRLFVIPAFPGSQAEEWDVEEMQRIQVHPLPAGPFRGAAFWDHYLVTEQADRTSLTDLSTDQIWRQLVRPARGDPAYDRGVSGLVASRNGASLLISRRSDEPSWIFQGAEERQFRQIVGLGTALSNDAKVVASPVSGHSIALVDSRTGKSLTTLSHHDRSGPVAFSPDDRTLAVCSGDRTVYLWNVATGQEMARLITRPTSFLSLMFSADGRRLAAIGMADQASHAADRPAEGGMQPAEIARGTAVITIWSSIDEP